VRERLTPMHVAIGGDSSSSSSSSSMIDAPQREICSVSELTLTPHLRHRSPLKRKIGYNNGQSPPPLLPRPLNERVHLKETLGFSVSL
jgi:hypothetical protein